MNLNCVKKGMSSKQAFISLSDEEVDPRPRKGIVQTFYCGSSQDRVAYKCRLDYEDLVHKKKNSNPPEKQAGWSCYFKMSPIRLNGKAFTTATCPCSIGIIEKETFSIQSAGKLECRVAQIEKTSQISDYLDAVILEDLIIRL